MGEFDDLFSRDAAIPRQAVMEFLGELETLFGHQVKLATRALGAVPEQDKLASAKNAARQALLEKVAVSTAWVANTTRRAAQNVSPGRLANAAEGSMKGVLNAAKSKSPLKQQALDKRMSLRNSLLGAQSTRSSFPPPRRPSTPGMSGSVAPMAKAASRDALLRRIKFAAAAQQLQSPPPGDKGPTAEEVAVAEQQAALQQVTQENEALKGQAQQLEQMVQQQAAAAEETEATNQQLQGQLQESGMAAQQAQQQAQDAMTQAQLQGQQAAAQADAKMRISLRVQQMRQQMADLASQDPVGEEGENVEPVMTATQQGEGPVADQQAQEQAAAEEQEGGQPGQPAQQPKAKPKAEKKPETPKTASLRELVLQRVKAAASSDKNAIEDAKRHSGHVGAIHGAAAGGALGGAYSATRRVQQTASKAIKAVKSIKDNPALAKLIGSDEVSKKVKKKGKKTLVKGVKATALSKAMRRGKSGLPLAAGAAIGAAAGYGYGRKKFDRDEGIKNVAAARSLAKEHVSRVQKSQEKTSHILSDDQLDRLFSL